MGLAGPRTKGMIRRGVFPEADGLEPWFLSAALSEEDVATTLTALAGEAPKLLMFPGLYLLGLGWSFGFVAGSALLTESVSEKDRVAVQGAADTAMNVASGLGALASGIVLDMAGFHILSFVGMAAAAGLLGQAWFENRIAAAQVDREPADVSK